MLGGIRQKKKKKLISRRKTKSKKAQLLRRQLTRLLKSPPKMANTNHRIRRLKLSKQMIQRSLNL